MQGDTLEDEPTETPASLTLSLSLSLFLSLSLSSLSLARSFSLSLTRTYLSTKTVVRSFFGFAQHKSSIDDPCGQQSTEGNLQRQEGEVSESVWKTRAGTLPLSMKTPREMGSDRACLSSKEGVLACQAKNRSTPNESYKFVSYQLPQVPLLIILLYSPTIYQSGYPPPRLPATFAPGSLSVRESVKKICGKNILDVPPGTSVRSRHELIWWKNVQNEAWP